LGPGVIDVFFCFGSRAGTGFLSAIYVCILLGIIPDDLVLVVLVVLVVVSCSSHSYYCSLMKSNSIFSCCFELIPNI
jgi:hypothetical protein